MKVLANQVRLSVKVTFNPTILGKRKLVYLKKLVQLVESSTTSNPQEKLHDE